MVVWYQMKALAALYSPGNRFCMRLDFRGSFEVFPTTAQPAIFFRAPYFENRWGDGVESVMVGKSRQFRVG